MNITKADGRYLFEEILGHVEKHDLFDKGSSTLVTDGYIYNLRTIWGVGIEDIDKAIDRLINHNYISRHNLENGNCYRLTAERRQVKQKSYLFQ